MTPGDPYLRPRSVRLVPGRAGRGALVLSSAALLLAWSGGGPVFVVVAAFGFGILAAAAVSTWCHAAALRVDAPAPVSAFAGDRFPIPVSVQNRATWFSAEDVTLRALGASKAGGAGAADFGARLRRALGWDGDGVAERARVGAFVERIEPFAVVPCDVVHAALRRGRHPQGVLEVASSFPLGLFVCRLRFDLPHDALILPRLGRVRRALRDETSARSEVVHGRAGRGDEQEVYGLRAWRAGESLRPVHWKLSARRGRLVAREFRSEPRPVVHVLLLTASDGTTRSAERRFEDAVSLAATLVEHFARHEHPVRLSVVGETTRTLRCRRGRAGATDALRELAEVRPSPPTRGGAAASLPPPTANERRFVVCVGGLRGAPVANGARSPSTEVLDAADPATRELFDRRRRRADLLTQGVAP